MWVILANMRVLVVTHGSFPDGDRPVSGGALRAWNHGEALRAAGHEVLFITRDQDRTDSGPPTFAGPRQLRDYARRVKPDRILCVQAEEAPALAGLGVPLCVDLYAPRLLEAAFDGSSEIEAVRTLQAIAAGDHFLFSNPRQRWHYLGLLALAGVDLRECSGAVVPLVAPEGPGRRLPTEPILVMGGVSWPWQDPTDAVRRAVAVLDKLGRGKVVIYGGRPTVGDCPVVDLPALVPPGPRLEYAGVVGWPSLLRAYAHASLALDLMAPNTERELALSFRQVEYLGCGLPLLTNSGHALSDAIRYAEAGWVVGDDLEGALLGALSDREELSRRGKNARALARSRFSREVAEKPLLDWVNTATIRSHAPMLLPEAAALAAALAEARGEAGRESALRAKMEAEVAEKRAEVARLTDAQQCLLGTVERLSRAVDEVAGFRREAVRVLGAQRDGAASEAEALSRELADLRADLAKKDAELRAARREIDRTHDALAAAQEEAKMAGDRLLERGRVEDKLRQQIQALRAQLARGPLARLFRRG